MSTASVLSKQQYKTFGPNAVSGYGQGAGIYALVRFDDQCGNGHNTFSITGTVRAPDSRGRAQREPVAAGCIHEDIAKSFPELAHLIKWHLCSTDGPMHYVANTIYLAGDRDCNGLQKGEFRQMRARDSGLPMWELAASYHDFGDFKTVESDMKPAPVTFEYRPYGRTGEGKARELDAARRCAIWPDATDEDLTAPGLKERLEARLPKLLEEFRKDVEALGFIW